MSTRYRVALVMILNKVGIQFLWNPYQIVNYPLLESIEILNDMTQRKFMEYHLIDIAIWPWSESWCPFRYQMYLVITMNVISGNRELGMTLMFGSC